MALSKRAIGSGKWQKLRIQILDRDGWVCVVCNRPAHTVDHIIPRVKGGDMWALDNLQSLCKPCNSRKGGRFFNSMPTCLFLPENGGNDPERPVFGPA
jgi:5-methylcytosine-specific restriction endonuclease McrA